VLFDPLFNEAYDYTTFLCLNQFDAAAGADTVCEDEISGGREQGWCYNYKVSDGDAYWEHPNGTPDRARMTFNPSKFSSAYKNGWLISPPVLVSEYAVVTARFFAKIDIKRLPGSLLVVAIAVADETQVINPEENQIASRVIKCDQIGPCLPPDSASSSDGWEAWELSVNVSTGTDRIAIGFLGAAEPSLAIVHLEIAELEVSAVYGARFWDRCFALDDNVNARRYHRILQLLS
jgi:hypothetical protein